MDDAIAAAKAAAFDQARRLRTQGASLPTSSSYDDVRHYSNGWAEARGIAWSEAVISLVALPVDQP